MNPGLMRAMELEMQRQALISMLILVLLFALVMYVVYRVTKAAIRDGINESRIARQARTWDDAVADAAETEQPRR